MLATPTANVQATETIAAARIQVLAAELADEIKAVTGCKTASVLLHAHRIPPERYHAINLPVEVGREQDGRPTMVSKRIGSLALFCAHRVLTDSVSMEDREMCPDLAAAIAKAEGRDS